MTSSSSCNGPYQLPLRLIHWTTAGLIVVQLGLVALNTIVYEYMPVLSEALVQGHMWIGLSILLVTLLRGCLRLALGPPFWCSKAAQNYEKLAAAVHLSLYGLLLTVAISGYLKLAWLGYRMEAFGLTVMPALEIAPDAAQYAKRIHTVSAVALVFLASCHAVVALQHRRLIGTPVMERMKIPASRFARRS